jgi:hypothetical protein
MGKHNSINRVFSGKLRTRDGKEFLVEIRVSPLDDGGVV